MEKPLNRIILIGGSAGSIHAASGLLSKLDEGLQAAVVIVMHLGKGTIDGLIRSLDNAGPLDVGVASQCGKIESNCVYLAPSDHHLFVRNNQFYLSRGPLVNRARPAIDLAFRSAAVSYRDKVVGVILSGMLDDGASGLNAINRCGGVSFVQDPHEALYPDMPNAALAYGRIDYLMPVAEIGEKINELAKEGSYITSKVPDLIALENRFDMDTSDDIGRMDELGEKVPFVCPECDGPLWQIKDDKVPRFRCHIGHTQSVHSLLQSQGEEIERTLWTAYRALEEKARLQENLARSDLSEINFTSFKNRAEETRGGAERIRNLIMALGDKGLAGD